MLLIEYRTFRSDLCNLAGTFIMKPFHLIIFLSLLLPSCGETESGTPNVSTQDTISGTPHDHHEEDALALNQGEKWVVDSLMLIHLRNMEKELSAFSPAGLSDYTGLAARLQSHTDLLTSNCTMEGPAHDELHKWLLPYMELVEKLGTAADQKEAETTVKEIQASFKIFNQYFH
ncbi:MAG: hypothetical protein IT233_05650 [Bacteroidia bacterium]|nr:hypothetical protein [Bacteroidia bacterium]